MHNSYNREVDIEDSIRNYFESLGLEPEVGDIYLTLSIRGGQTISELSRNSGVERTHIYRLLDTLQNANLIEIDSEYKHGILRAAPLSNVHILLAEKSQQLQTLQDDLPLLEAALTKNRLQAPRSSVQFYRGEAGVKQMLWNETNANSEIRGILYQNIQLKTKSKFFERWTDKCNERGLHFRGIISDEFQRNQRAWYEGIVKERLAHWTPRYVSPAQFPITHSTIMYDDVVGYFNWQDDEIFGIEVHNADIACTQKAFFELLWQQSRPSS